MDCSKTVMLSIKPKWCELIASGKKTVEIRKTRPKIETPFKCYIYQTVDGRTNSVDVLENNLSKVIGEFVCDYILEITLDPYGHHEYFISDDDLNASCLNVNDLWEYANGKPLCGWHISELVIYDKPKKLSEFRHCGVNYHFNPIINKPPQSWCYVEPMEV